MRLRRLFVVALTVVTLPVLGAAALPGALGGDGGKCWGCPHPPPKPNAIGVMPGS